MADRSCSRCHQLEQPFQLPTEFSELTLPPCPLPLNLKSPFSRPPPPLLLLLPPRAAGLLLLPFEEAAAGEDSSSARLAVSTSRAAALLLQLPRPCGLLGILAVLPQRLPSCSARLAAAAAADCGEPAARREG